MLADTTFGSVFTYTRAGTAYDFSAAGVLTEYAANAIRSNTTQGWLLEGAATNSVRNSRAEYSSPPTFPTTTQPNFWARSSSSGLTIEFNAPGTDTATGLPYIDVRWYGTATATGTANSAFPETGNAVAITNGATGFASVYLRHVGGSLNGVFSIGLVTNVNNAGGSFSSGGGSSGDQRAAITAAGLGFARVSTAFTVSDVNAAFITPNIAIGVTNGQAIDITLRVAAPQLEIGNYFASSPILPAVGVRTATTRSADALSITGSAFTNLFGGLPVRTNLILQSAALDNASWSKGNVTIVADAVSDPFGGTTADQVVESVAVSAFHSASQSVSKAASNIVYTYSVYIKDSGGRQVTVNLQSGGSNGAVCRVDPAAGTITQAGAVFGTGWSAASATITAAGSNWYRVTLTATSDTLTTVQAQLSLYNTGLTTNVYTGDGTSGCYAAGQQLETGSTATAYIPTTTVAVAAGGPTQGAVVVDCMMDAFSNGAVRPCVSIDDGTAANVLTARPGASSVTPLVVAIQSSAQTSAGGGGSVPYGTPFRMGLRWSAGSAGVCLNGGTIGTLSWTAAGMTNLRVGFDVNGQLRVNGRISKVRAYGYAPTDAEFQSFCTLGT